MRITSARSWVESLELSRPYSIAFASFDQVQVLFVVLTTDDGHVGVGSGSPVEVITGETLESAASALESHLEGLVLGKDVRQLGSILHQLDTRISATPAARAAVDIALHDLFAQRLELPLVEVLGRSHEVLPTSITIGIKESIEESVEEAQEYLGRGFRCLKLKIGSSLEQDLATIAHVREAVGDTITLRVDVNQGYDLESTRRLATEAPVWGVELLEQPLPQEDTGAMLELPPSVRRLCAADESLRTPADALALTTRPQPFGIFNIKLMKCGGIAPARSIAELARLGGIDLMWGCMDESIASIAAALHTAFSCPATRYLDLDGSLDLARDLVTGGFVLEDGLLRTKNAPGLGVRLLEPAVTS
ncbi:MAG: dipeptide epimerase [Acidobacteria bacterium]|nr:dipeptide epimerase [Acidobacteriota bacterium]